MATVTVWGSPWDITIGSQWHVKNAYGSNYYIDQGPWYGEATSYFDFDSKIPAGATVNSVTLTLSYTTPNTGVADLRVGEVNATVGQAWSLTGNPNNYYGWQAINRTLKFWFKCNGKTYGEEKWYTSNIVLVNVGFIVDYTPAPQDNPGTLSASDYAISAGSQVSIYVGASDAGLSRSLSVWYGSGYNTQLSEGYKDLTTAAQTVTYDIPFSWLESIAPNSTSAKIMFWMEAKRGSTRVGTREVVVTVNVPQEIVPVIGTFTPTPIRNGVPENISGYIQNVMGVRLTMSSPQGVYGSTIKSYSITGPSLNVTGSLSHTITKLPTAGTITYTATATDSRGRTATKQVSITVVAYSQPVVQSIDVWRADSGGSPLDNGTYLYVMATGSYQAMTNNTLTLHGRAYERGASGITPDSPAWVTLTAGQPTAVKSGAAESKYYVIEVKAQDVISMSPIQQRDILTSFVAIDMPLDGSGMGLGTYAKQNTLAVGFDKLELNGKSFLDKVYPIGSIFMSINSTSPDTFLYGTWLPIPAGRVLRTGSGGTENGSDTNSGITVTGYVEATTSGSNLVYRYQNTPAWESQWRVPLGSSGNSGGGSIGTGFTIKGTGSGGSNVPLSYHVYAWRRTA